MMTPMTGDILKLAGFFGLLAGRGLPTGRRSTAWGREIDDDLDGSAGPEARAAGAGSALLGCAFGRRDFLSFHDIVIDIIEFAVFGFNYCHGGFLSSCFCLFASGERE
jgi:hypothetical protein